MAMKKPVKKQIKKQVAKKKLVPKKPKTLREKIRARKKMLDDL